MVLVVRSLLQRTSSIGHKMAPDQGVQSNQHYGKQLGKSNSGKTKDEKTVKL